MDSDFNIFRLLQIIIGLVLIFESLYKPGILRKKLNISSHRVNRMFYFAGGLVLLALGIFGKLPRI